MLFMLSVLRCVSGAELVPVAFLSSVRLSGLLRLVLCMFCGWCFLAFYSVLGT